jgi:2-methylcitrate dehydratase PrpD
VATRPRSRELAAYLVALRLRDLPADTLRLLKLCVLDHFGCALGALETEAGRAAIRAARFGAGGSCTVIGSTSRAAPETAALVNGTLAHALIFDDLHRQAKLHPGVAVIPAALAAAEQVQADGARFLTAIAAGYEAAARTGMAIGMAAHRARGWRATGTCGSFGAAVAAASVLGADASAMHDAIAFAAAQASGNWAFAQSGGMELYLAAGTAARNGVVAAALAQSGFHGAADPLEARDGGFFTLTSSEPRPELLTDRLGERLRLSDTCIKMYPTCHSTQTGIDAVLNLRARHGLTPGLIERIEVRAGEITRVQCGWPFEPGPPSRMIFHMGYALAVALKRGKLLPADFEGESLSDPELARIARATEVIADPELTAVYEQRKPCDVSLILRDGRTLHERVDYCRGEPENPPTEQAVVAKFRDLTAPHLSQTAADCIVEFVMDAERRTNLGPLAQALQKR